MTLPNRSHLSFRFARRSRAVTEAPSSRRVCECPSHRFAGIASRDGRYIGHPSRRVVNLHLPGVKQSRGACVLESVNDSQRIIKHASWGDSVWKQVLVYYDKPATA